MANRTTSNQPAPPPVEQLYTISFGSSGRKSSVDQK